MNRYLLTAVIATLTTGMGCAKVVVVPVPAGSKVDGEGVFYALPKTVARVVVKADKAVSKSAPFARFAPIFAPGNTPPCGSILQCAAVQPGAETTTKYSIQQGATFSTFGEPDPAHVFMVKFADGGTLDQTLSMAWSEAGLMSTTSASVTNRIVDITLAGLKLATSLGTKAAAGAGTLGPDKRPTVELPTSEKCPGPGRKDNDSWIIPILLLIQPKPEENVLVANFCDLPPSNRTGTAEDSRDDFDRTRDEDLLLAAVRSFAFRVCPLVEQRTLLLTSPTAVSVLEPVKYVEKLDALIDAPLKQLFVGNKTNTLWELSFDVRTLDPASPQEILKLSETSGICPVDRLLAPEAKPAPDGFQDGIPKNCDKSVTVSVGYHPEVGQQLFSTIRQSVQDKAGDRSFRYRLPAQVRAVVTMNQTMYGSAVFAVAQLGHVVSLPAARQSKTISYDLAMIEATGALKTFKLGTTGGLDAATIDTIAAAGGTVIDARNERRKKAEEEADELTVLTRQQTILKLKDEICELQKKFGLACNVQP
jgi:hypothetical protein